MQIVTPLPSLMPNLKVNAMAFTTRPDSETVFNYEEFEDPQSLCEEDLVELGCIERRTCTFNSLSDFVS